MKTVKLGIIGFGYIGQIHLRNSVKLENAEVVGVADVSQKALNKAKKFGVKKIFSDYKDLLQDPEIDAVLISLPTHLHLQCTRDSAEAGKDIFLEKPIARNSDEAKELLAEVNKHSVKLMVGYHLPFHSGFREIKESMDKGILGDVVTAHAIFIASGPFFHRAEGYSPVPVPEWWFNKQLTGGGVLIDLGSHMINLLRWYFGEIKDIRSCLGYRFNMDFEDSALCMIKFESGTKAVVDVGWFSQDFMLKLDLLGSVKHASATHLPSSKIRQGLQMLMTGTSEFFKPHIDEVKHFVNCLNQDVNPFPSGQDGLKDIEAIELAYKNTIALKD